MNVESVGGWGFELIEPKSGKRGTGVRKPEAALRPLSQHRGQQPPSSSSIASHPPPKSNFLQKNPF